MKKLLLALGFAAVLSVAGSAAANAKDMNYHHDEYNRHEKVIVVKERVEPRREIRRERMHEERFRPVYRHENYRPVCR
jgi:coproporphyrinogen III oxidase-like Fe-S oxidoreductase